MGKTSIEWTDRSWNPVTGCTKVSPGCDHCYAENIAHRFDGTKAYPNGFDVTLRPERLDQPLRWRHPARVFVNSMSDLFHKDIPDDYIARVFAVMALAPQHTFQILTKRPGRMRSLLNAGDFHTAVAENMLAMTREEELPDVGDPLPLPNVWLGVSTENQKWADVRIPQLLATPAAVRFVSAEPLLGGIDLSGYVGHLPEDEDGAPYPRGLDWVIVGGESGSGARPMHPQWARELRDQCVGNEVAFHFKQFGEWVEDVFVEPDGYTHWAGPKPEPKDRNRIAMNLNGSTALTSDNPFDPFAAGHFGWTVMRRVGKKQAGRSLDGCTWDEFPAVVS